MSAAAREVLCLYLAPQVLTTCQVGSHEVGWFYAKHTVSRSYCSAFVLKILSFKLVTRTLVFVERDVSQNETFGLFGLYFKSA